ncbi:capsule-associated protein CAP1 [Mycoblastus sanguinarius]|nr:capsule-associated protein CAP1 [Mycoblastus sanguinarius]
MRRTQLATFLGLFTFVGVTLFFLRRQPPHKPIDVPSPELDKVLPPSTETSHPIYQLITKAEEEFESLKAGQSDSLAKAVEEYRRRYKLPPPPNFDKWYDFAKARDVQLIDEYDTIHNSLLPFWGLQPSVIRGRAREALGFDNALLGVIIRDGQTISAAGGTEWQQKSTVGMIEGFVKYLPDMDLPFNIHDEPRVIVPHDDLSRLVAVAKNWTMPAAFENNRPKNAWSPRPADMDDGTRPNEVKNTRFNFFAHQPTWTNSRISCSPESPARVLDESIQDDGSSFSFSQLGFVFNKTAFSDICLSPSLKERHGFFNRPNAFNIVHDLFPVFSQSKISSYQDILYPSPWYWSNKVAYDETNDYSWEKKKNKLYWRGSTTGGYSRNGGWRRQHRQLFVEKINALDNTKIMENQSTSGGSDWKVKEAARTVYKDLFDVKFAHVGQCDQNDCDAQKEFFEVVKPDKQYDAWQYKYLLDIDGNAFSGRFYAFLKSMSLVYKMAVFREWHEEWLRPWVHYVPLGLKGDEYVESVRYFDDEPDGKIQAPKLAIQGREWAFKVLRNEDFEVWLFRLLMEWVFSVKTRSKRTDAL